jgi:hypothetical protein
MGGNLLIGFPERKLLQAIIAANAAITNGTV